MPFCFSSFCLSAHRELCNTPPRGGQPFPQRDLILTWGMASPPKGKTRHYINYIKYFGSFFVGVVTQGDPSDESLIDEASEILDGFTLLRGK